MTPGAPRTRERVSAPGWVRWALSARDGLVHAFPLEDSEYGRWPQAACLHTVPPAAMVMGVTGRCPECVLRVSAPGTGRRHRRIAPAGVLVRVLARWQARRTTVPVGALVSEFPVITLPLPALGDRAGRVGGAVGPGGPALGLVPPRPVHTRPPR